MPYISVFCWKCKTQNNFAETKTCRQCGCYLKNYDSRQNVSSVFSESATESPIFRMFVITMAVVVLVAAGYVIAFRKSGGEVASQPTAVEILPDGTIEPPVGLPADSWHRPSIWNLYRGAPTVREILEKNNRVTSQTLKPSDLQTISFTGTVSIAALGCQTEECFRQEQQQQAARQGAANGGFVPLSVPFNNPMRPKPSDDFDKPDYTEAGDIEIYGKRPDKTFSRVVVNLNTRTAETTEAFNGLSGWRRKEISDGEKIIESEIKALTEEELEALKLSAAAIWQNNSYAEETLTFSRLAKVNEKVHFVVRRKNGEKTETLYFDAVSGFLTKVTSGETNCYLYPYADYSGVKFPSAIYYRMTDANSGKIQWMKIDNLEWVINEPIDDELFDRPLE